jgi:hypothetical protein
MRPFTFCLSWFFNENTVKCSDSGEERHKNTKNKLGNYATLKPALTKIVKIRHNIFQIGGFSGVVEYTFTEVH